MPLIKSSSDAAFKSNLKAELKAGKPRDQALAIAYRIKRERAAGGRLPSFTGPISSAVPGRTDHHPMEVPAGSYVVPAETVSHLGQNNTQAGLAVLNRMFSSGPYGVKLPRIKRGPGAPRAPRVRSKQDGGSVGEPVPIYAAGGEYVIPPEVVTDIGGGDIDQGHKILDAWVLSQRKQHIKTLKRLPPPARD